MTANEAPEIAFKEGFEAGKQSVFQDLITPKQFAEMLREFEAQYATDDAHMYADNLMIEILRCLGYSEGCDIFENMHKWYA